MKQNYTIIGAIFLMVLAFLMAAYLYNSQQTDTQTQLATQNADALSKPYSPRKGNPAAKVTIVEFLDPACETCRQFHPLVKELLATYRGKVNLVIRYAPLHPGSDHMVKILEAAKKQGKFWEVLELMFETQSHWASHHQPKPEIFWTYLERFGFDVAQLREDVNSPEIAKIIQQDIADGQRLGATKTPTFFVNGKPLSRFGYEPLKNLVASEVNIHYPRS